MPPDLPDVLAKLGTALALGLLVGLQRERAQGHVAGIRTFALISVCGCFCGLLHPWLGAWVVGAGLLAVAATVILGHLLLPAPERHPGVTTQVAALVMFLVGVWLAMVGKVVPVVVAGAMCLLLQFKEPMHRFAQRIGPGDMRAMMQFVLITLVILPILPDRAFGPYQVLNPREVWLMVVLIVTISLGAYVLAKLFGERAGTLLGATLGGIISSTATTVSYARRARAEALEGRDSSTDSCLMVMIASTIAFLRFVALVVAVVPGQAKAIIPPLLALGGVLGLVTLWLAIAGRNRPAVPAGERPGTAQRNPAELKTALVFGVLYAVVILLVAAANDLLGQGAMYAVAVVSGTTDMDAITLSAARLVEQGTLETEVAWRLILVAALSNLVFKGILAAALGTRALARRVGIAFAVSLLGGAAILVFWP